MKFWKPLLPFIWNKKNFLKVIIETIKESKEIVPYAEDFVVVDLFWGSWLLSHIVKKNFTQARVIFNDFENYKQRVDNIKDTEELRKNIYEKITYKYNLKDKINEIDKNKIIEIIEKHKEEWKFFDERSIVNWLSFSWIVATYTTLLKNNFFNKVPKTELIVNNNYLEGVEIVSMDYRELLKKIPNTKNTLFLFDPPYLNTNNWSYKILDSFSLKDYLKMIFYLENRNFLFFTSEKSDLVEFIDFINENKIKDINYKLKDRINGVSKKIKYKDIMLFNI